MEKEYIHFTIKSDWEYIRIFREFIYNIFLYRADNKNKAYDISFIISELFENSVKYLSDGNVQIKINFISDDRVEIKFTNKVEEKNRIALKSEIMKMKNKSPKEILNDNFLTDSSWSKSKGRFGFLMIYERVMGKIHVSFKKSYVSVKCIFSYKS